MNNSSPQSEERLLTREEQILENLYTRTDVPTTLTWANVQARRSQSVQIAASNKARRRVTDPVWIRQAPSGMKRVAVIFAAVLLFAVVVGATYASGGFDALITALTHNDPGATSVLNADQFTTLNQIRTVDGATGKLEAVYADANRLILGISIDTSKLPPAGAGGNWVLDQRLTTSDGVALPAMGLSDNVDAKNLGSLITFNTDQIQGSPASLQVHAVFSYYCMSLNGGQCSPAASVHNYANPLKLTYDFTVPFHAGRVVTVHQTLSSNGKAVTIERVVITPSETRIYIHGLTYFEMSPHTFEANDDSRLTVGDTTYHKLGLVPLGDPTDATGPHILDTYISLLQPIDSSKHSAWTLHILDPRQGPGWTFHFTV